MTPFAKGIFVMLRKPSAVTLLVLLASGCAVSSTVGFKPPQNYPVGTNPRAVVKADFNADGNMDLAVANYGDPAVSDDGNISILLGNGDGTFRSATNFVGVKNCTGLLEADFDNDGKSDLALIRHGDPAVNDSGDVTIFFGNGDGTFHKGQTVTTGRNFISVVAADFNLDQRPDLAISQTDNSVSVLMGNGDGTFQAPVVYATPTGNLDGKSLKVLDFNQDGIKDLAALDAGGDILLGNGDGSFHLGPSIPLELFTSFQLTGDFNGDGKVDLLATHCNPFNPGCGEQLLLGNGDGTFTGVTGLSLLVYGAYTPGDFNGDGKLDLAGTAQVNGNPAVVVCLGNGDGTFQAAATFPAGPDVFATLADDLNGDKAPDLVIINSPSSIGVLLNAGTDFSISASAPSPSILSHGQSSSSTLTLSLLNGFDNPVSLSCALTPAQAGSPTCSLSSNSVTFDSAGKASATVTVTAGAVAAAVRVPPARHGGPNLFALGWLPVAGFAFMGIRLSCTRPRKGKVHFLAVAAVFAGLILLVSCGGGSGSSPPLNYAITITAISGSTQHSTTVTLTVQ
jgi:hypothetical protein